MESEKVSIILPTYNRADCIETSINSVLEQTYRKFELLIVDDGSSDNTKQIVENIEDDRIRYIGIPENRGVAAARNEGIRQASCEYIAFQDSDDCWKPDKLEKQMLFFMNCSQRTAMVYCACEVRIADGSIVTIPDTRLPLQDKQGDIYHKLLCRNTIDAPTALLRKESLEKTGLFCENLFGLEDWELFVRIAKDYEIAFLEEPLVIAHLRDDGVSSNVAGYFEARCYMVAQHKETLLQCGQFNNVVQDILLRAQRNGIIEPVNRLLQLYLQ